MISTKGRYALRVMLDLAEHQEAGYLSLKEVADRQQISAKYLETIVAMLLRAGLVRSQRGKEGGYCLSRPAGEITAAEVLRMTEGTLSPVACPSLEGQPCQRAETCKTLPLWRALDERVERCLSAVTLEDLLQGRLPEDTPTTC